MNNNSSNPVSSVFIFICIMINICSSICIVMINKWIYTYYHFPNISLTCIHFVMTSIGLKLCAAFDLFLPRSVPIKSMIPLSLSFCGFVVLTNLSLQFNTVGTYQIIKVLTTPCIMLIHVLFYKKTYSLKISLTLIPITIGVLLNSYYDIKFNLIGAIFAFIGVLVTSVYQVWVGTTQKDLNINSMQLLNYQAPLSAAMLLMVIPIFEPIYGEGSVFQSWPPKVWLLVVASGCVAFLINLTIFWIIGNTSPVTYNIVGHTKFCATLTIGYFLFKYQVLFNQFVGVLSTIAGILLYTHYKVQQQQNQNTVAKV